MKPCQESLKFTLMIVLINHGVLDVVILSPE